MSDRPVERLLGNEGHDSGCEAGFELLDQYCEALLRGEDVASRYPEIVTHIQNCWACREDTEGLLAVLKELDRD